jgi:hypothetical protein
MSLHRITQNGSLRSSRITARGTPRPLLSSTACFADVGLLAGLILEPESRQDYIWIVVALTGLPPAANVFSVSRERFA